MSLKRSASFNASSLWRCSTTKLDMVQIKKSPTLPNLSADAVTASLTGSETPSGDFESIFLDRNVKLKAKSAIPRSTKSSKTSQRRPLFNLTVFRASEYRNSVFVSEASFEKKLVELANYRYPHQHNRRASTTLACAQHPDYAAFNTSLSSLNSFHSTSDQGGNLTNASNFSLHKAFPSTEKQSAGTGKAVEPSTNSTLIQPDSMSKSFILTPKQNGTVDGERLLSDSLLGLVLAELPESQLLLTSATSVGGAKGPKETGFSASTDFSAQGIVDTQAKRAGTSRVDKRQIGLQDGRTAEKLLEKNLTPIVDPEDAGLELIAIQPENEVKMRFYSNRSGSPSLSSSANTVRLFSDTRACASAELQGFSFPQSSSAKRQNTQSSVTNCSLQSSASSTNSSLRQKLWRWKKSSNGGEGSCRSRNHSTNKRPEDFTPNALKLHQLHTPSFDECNSSRGNYSLDTSFSNSFNSASSEAFNSPRTAFSKLFSLKEEALSQSSPASVLVAANGREAEYRELSKSHCLADGKHARCGSTMPPVAQAPVGEWQEKEIALKLRLQQRRSATVCGPLPMQFYRFEDSSIKQKTLGVTGSKHPQDTSKLFEKSSKSENRCSSYHYYMGDKRRHYTPRRVIETKTVYAKQSKQTTWVNPIKGEINVSQGKINQYVILRNIGSGAYGWVVLVQSELDNRYYACKIMSKSRLRKKFRWNNVDTIKQQRPPPSRDSNCQNGIELLSGCSSYCGSPSSSRPQSPISPPSSSLVHVSASPNFAPLSGTPTFRQGNLSGSSSESTSKSSNWNMEREVAILKKISKHPNINALIEVLDDLQEDNLYLIFELCEYGPVMKLKAFEKVRPFSENLARQYFREVLLGLEYLHHKRIIHCDIKPENLLLTADKHLQIADFGISHMFDENVSEPLVSSTNMSPIFAPPEACDPDNVYVRGKTADIWGLGVSLYCFVHGHCPFEAASPVELCKKIMYSKLQLESSLSEELKDLLARMLCKAPEQRLSLSEIKVHAWVTENGTSQMLSTEDNCVFEDVTEEEVATALQPASSIFSKLVRKFKKSKPR